ncbi:MAG: DNA polymerase III subunit gamma/tau [Candidatus Pelagibacterales bacterium]|tara:strand:- start:1350 stop:2621 length:1272 start_codon:yes stop_codon:yes gene_type:complete
MSEQKNLPIPLKYRPLKFSELIGQNLMSQTIQKAIETDRIANAYLLTGVRGVGKTTTARIIAKSLNCMNIDSNDEKEPCGVCENCIAITESRSVDVYEMDAASRTGIADIRELIEGVQYSPVSSKYKVYIIDEVHMLSTAAFNGLLKTLEEPPPHVKFIFATTEVRKIPTTILSRCQRYDLKRVEPEELIVFLKKICDMESVQFDDGSLKIIARAADGSVRDGLSILDQSITFSDKELTENKVKEMIGLNDPTEIIDFIKLLTSGETIKCIEMINSFYDNGADPSVIVRDLIASVHDISMVKISADQGVKNSLTEAEYKEVKEIADNVDLPTLSMFWQMLNKGLGEVSESFSPISALEMLIIRIIYLNDIPKPDQLIGDLNNLVENEANNIESIKVRESKEMDPKLKEIVDFFPGTKVENLEE